MKTLVQPNSPEWMSVHYRLQLVLGLPAALPLKIYKFNNFQQQYSELKHRYHNKTIIDAHINLSAYDQASQKKLMEKKIKISSLIIEAGHLNIHLDAKEIKKSSVLLMKAAVGDSYCLQTLAKNEVPSNVPDRYDSLYLCSNEGQHVYKHNYILKEADQYALEYEIVYTLQKKREYNVRDVSCYKCLKRSATIYCKQQQAFFCSQCNFSHHKDGLLSSHVRQELTKFNTVELCQQSNHNKRLEMYCESCMKIMCVECIMNGWHSHRDFSAHETKPLKKYCQQKLLQNEQNSRQRRGELEDALKALEEMMVDVDNHALGLQKKITQIYESLLKDLKENTKIKLDKLLVVKTELKRKYDELIWADSFIRYQQQLLKPSLYIDAQKEYEKIKQHLVDSPFPSLPKIIVDGLQIEGDLKLVEIQSGKKLYSEYSDNKLIDNKFSRHKSHSQTDKRSLNSKYSGHKPSLKSILNPPNEPIKYLSSNSRPGINLQIEVPTQKQKSISHHSIDQSRSNDITAPLLERSIKNANLTSLKFS